MHATVPDHQSNKTCQRWDSFVIPESIVVRRDKSSHQLFIVIAGTVLFFFASGYMLELAPLLLFMLYPLSFDINYMLYKKGRFCRARLDCMQNKALFQILEICLRSLETPKLYVTSSNRCYNFFIFFLFMKLLHSTSRVECKLT